MKNLNLQLIILSLQLSYYTIVNSQVPASGCNAISSEGTCFSYFTSGGVNWTDANQGCEMRGYDLAKVTSPEENIVMYSAATDSVQCWIGLNDRDIEGTYVWTDGSSNDYIPWSLNQPDNSNNEDCVDSISLGVWNDHRCSFVLSCYFCSNNVTAFGQIIESTYSPLADNTVLTSDTTLYCVTENNNTPQVVWSYVDLFGIRTNLTSTTNASTGVSIIQAYTMLPGYYSCGVTQNGGYSRIYTALVTNPFLGSEIRNLNIGNTSESSILISWDLLGPVLSFGNLITFSIYLRTPNYDIVTTTNDLEIELTHLVSNLNYTILVELQVPFTTHTISTTSYYVLASTTTANVSPQNANPLTQYSPYITTIGLIIIIALMVLAFFMQLIICCILKRRATKEDIQGISALIDTVNKKDNCVYSDIAEYSVMQAGEKSSKEVYINKNNTGYEN